MEETGTAGDQEAELGCWWKVDELCIRAWKLVETGTATSVFNLRLLSHIQSCHDPACSSKSHALVLAGDHVPSFFSGLEFWQDSNEWDWYMRCNRTPLGLSFKIFIFFHGSMSE